MHLKRKLSNLQNAKVQGIVGAKDSPQLAGALSFTVCLVAVSDYNHKVGSIVV